MAAITLLPLAGCASFDPDERYRCATDGDCIAGYACVQSVCAALTAPAPHRVLYRRAGAAADLLARAPGEDAVSLTEPLEDLGLPPEPDSGAFAPGGGWLAYATTGGAVECDGYACLAVASGALDGAALVIVDQTSAPVHPSGGPMDIDDAASRIAYVVDFGVLVVDRVGGEPLDGGRWSGPVPVGGGAPAGSGLAFGPVLLPSGDRDRIAWACGPEPYVNDGRGICHRRLGAGPAPLGDVERIGPEALPGGTDEGWLTSPRYAWVGGAPRLAFVARVAGATNLWHTALDGTDPQKVTAELADGPTYVHLCAAGDRAAVLTTDGATFALDWLSLGGDRQVLETLQGGEPAPALLGCH